MERRNDGRKILGIFPTSRDGRKNNNKINAEEDRKKKQRQNLKNK